MSKAYGESLLECEPMDQWSAREYELQVGYEMGEVIARAWPLDVAPGPEGETVQISILGQVLAPGKPSAPIRLSVDEFEYITVHVSVPNKQTGQDTAVYTVRVDRAESEARYVGHLIALTGGLKHWPNNDIIKEGYSELRTQLGRTIHTQVQCPRKCEKF